jgi:hypothetical protein
VVAPWGCSSVGRAQGWQSWGQGFESPQLHQIVSTGLRSRPQPRARQGIQLLLVVIGLPQVAVEPGNLRKSPWHWVCELFPSCREKCDPGSALCPADRSRARSRRASGQAGRREPVRRHQLRRERGLRERSAGRRQGGGDRAPPAARAARRSSGKPAQVIPIDRRRRRPALTSATSTFLDLAYLREQAAETCRRAGDPRAEAAAACVRAGRARSAARQLGRLPRRSVAQRHDRDEPAGVARRVAQREQTQRSLPPGGPRGREWRVAASAAAPVARARSKASRIR